MKFSIMTLFPEYMDFLLGQSIIGRARKEGILEIRCHNFRDYAHDRHSTVDDTPYGGGMGMLLKPEPIYECYQAIVEQSEIKPLCVYMSPKGRVLDQALACELAQQEHVLFLCGHYEGVDQRVLDRIVDMELSIGDYVLTGGELPAAVAVDCIARLVPGVLAEEECFTEESHYGGLLEYPHYTRPQIFMGESVPKVLLGGNHNEIERWRRRRALEITRRNRPDMLLKASLTPFDLDLLEAWMDDSPAAREDAEKVQ